MRRTGRTVSTTKFLTRIRAQVEMQDKLVMVMMMHQVPMKEKRSSIPSSVAPKKRHDGRENDKDNFNKG